MVKVVDPCAGSVLRAVAEPGQGSVDVADLFVEAGLANIDNHELSAE